jgi:hypothetical protein
VLHLSFLVLEEVENCHSGPRSSEMKWQGNEFLPDFGFLPIESSMGQHPGHFRIRRERTTVVVSGQDRFKWHGYAFGKLGLSDLGEEDNNDYEHVHASCYEDEGEDPGPMEDFFVTGGCEALVHYHEPALDPRVCFLLSTQNRLEIVSQYYEYLVRKLDAGFTSWVGPTVDA